MCRLRFSPLLNLKQEEPEAAVSGVTMQRIASLLFRGVPSQMVVRGAATLILACFLSGCSPFRALKSGASGSWLDNGSLALSRPVPTQVSTERASLAASSIPALSQSDVAQIVISRSSRTITAIQPGSAPITFKTEGAQLLPAGSFSITLKENGPLWYAPNEYFTKRALPVPEQGSRARFLRAALGQQALYLNDQTPIHSGPVWLREIGGLRLKRSEMDQLYSLVTVGTRVEVR